MPITKDTIGVGFIGAGDISILHAAAVKKCPGAKLVGLWNRNQDRAKQRAAEFGCKNYATPEELVNDPADRRGVRPHQSRNAPRIHQARARCRQARPGREAGRRVGRRDRADDGSWRTRRDLVCMPGHNYVYEQSMMRTRELVENGDLGKIVSAYVMYNIHHPEEVAKRYPGVVRQILTHHSYILLYLVGKPVELCAMKATLHYKEYTEEDIAMVQMRLANGALAHFCASFAADDHAADPWTVMVKVIGTAGSTRYSYRDHVEIKPGLVHSQTYTAYQGSITNEVRHFLVDCLRMGAKPLSTLDDAITAQKMIEAAEKSIAEKSVVKL